MADSLLGEINPNQDEREALLNKWKDKPQQDLLNAKVESDLYIKTLTARFDDLKNDYLQLRDQHQASAQLKDLIDQMKSKPSNNDTDPNTSGNNLNQPAIKPEDIESLIETRVAEKFNTHQQSLKQKENLANVQAKLKEHFGDNYQSAYSQRLEALGLTSEYADDLAKNYPNVFIKTFELESRQNTPQSLPRSTQRNTSFAPTTIKKDWNYYQEMKKSNPKLYLDPKIANEMHDQAILLGPDFGMPLD